MLIEMPRALGMARAISIPIYLMVIGLGSNTCRTDWLASSSIILLELATRPRWLGASHAGAKTRLKHWVSPTQKPKINDWH